MDTKYIFSEELISSWKGFLEILNNFTHRWIFRGQSSDYRLTTSLERACKDLGISLKEAPGIEQQLIRDFRRRYSGPDRDLLLADTLYCLSLMQHHGAPTRLLDWTYSPFVAGYFALEKALSSNCVVWCLNGDWCSEQAISIVGKELLEKREKDETRTDETFKPLYMGQKRYKLVLTENPHSLNERLIIQKGVFLCPGNVAMKFESNLKALKGWTSSDCILKLRFQMGKQEHLKALEELHRMNVTRDNLFPGLDGFAQSLKQKMPIYERMAARGAGGAVPRRV